MPKMICTTCQTEYRPKTNGVLVIEMAAFGAYKVYSADLWYCPGCDNEVISGFGKADDLKLLRSDHYQEDFDKWLEKTKKNYEKRGVPIFFDYEKPQIPHNSIEIDPDDNDFATTLEEMKDDEDTSNLMGDS